MTTPSTLNLAIQSPNGVPGGQHVRAADLALLRAAAGRADISGTMSRLTAADGQDGFARTEASASRSGDIRLAHSPGQTGRIAADRHFQNFQRLVRQAQNKGLKPENSKEMKAYARAINDLDGAARTDDAAKVNRALNRANAAAARAQRWVSSTYAV